MEGSNSDEDALVYKGTGGVTKFGLHSKSHRRAEHSLIMFHKFRLS
jgi:hypothetical protein